MFFKKRKGMDFVDRGDPAAADFNKDTLSLDGAYHELDLSSIIPKAARLVMLRIILQTSAGYPVATLRKKGNANVLSNDSMRVITTGVPYYDTMLVACGSDGIIEYDISAATYHSCNITVAGWWE